MARGTRHATPKARIVKAGIMAVVALFAVSACSSSKTSSSGSSSAGGAATSAAAGSGAPSSASGTVYKARVNVVEAPGTYEYDYVKSFTDMATQLSGGRLQFTLYANSVLGGQSESIGQLQANTYQFVDDTYTAADTIVPDTDVMTLPGVWKSGQQFADAWNGGAVGQAIEKEFEAKGVIGVGAAYLGNQDIASNKQISSVADLKGLKIRVLTGPYLQAACQALGMVPENVNVNEIPTSVKTGLLNSIANASFTIYSSKRYEFFKYISLAQFYPANIGLMGSAKFYDSLPPDLQQDIMKAGYSASNTLSAGATDRLNSAVTSLQKLGLKVTSLPADQQTLMTQTIEQPVQDLWKKNRGDTILNLALNQQ
jgi:TRAP-type C4-dicarboxylate transport system substrate-binding protein